MASSRSFPVSRILTVLVAVLLVLSFIPTSEGPALEVFFSKAGFGQVGRTAESYLEVQREQALKGFLLLSALKVGLAVLKSSEVGFILNVKVGDLAVAAYDYVDFGWKVLLAAVAYYYIAEYLIDLAAVVNIWFLWGALVSILIWCLVREFRPDGEVLRTAAARTAVAGSILAILLYVGLPLSMVGAGWVSDHITGGPITAANDLYKDMGENIPSLLGDEDGEKTGVNASDIRTPRVTVPVPYDGTDPSQAVTEFPPGNGTGFLTIFISGENFKKFKEYLQERSKALASAVLRQTAAYLFNIVVFPLLMLAVLYLGSKYLMGLMLMR